MLYVESYKNKSKRIQLLLIRHLEVPIGQKNYHHLPYMVVISMKIITPKM